LTKETFLNDSNIKTPTLTDNNSFAHFGDYAGIVSKAKIGDIIWVRETFFAEGFWDFAGKTKKGKQKYRFDDSTYCSSNMPNHGYKYCDNMPERVLKFPSQQKGYYKRSSFFMPKNACRLFLEVISVSVERLQDIDEQSAINEGIENLSADEAKFNLFRNYLRSEKEANYQDFTTDNPIWSYQTLWQKINGKDSWDLNPFVWVYKFRSIPVPPDFC
jgi:hypothetical protein